MPENTPSRTPAIYLVLAWGFVSIPLAWGVYKSVLNALALFK
jgi:hypothetical protein